MSQMPTGFIPQQDKGYLLVNVQLPDGAAVERTRQVMQRIEGMAREMPGVAHTVAISGQSLLLGANAPNFGSMYVMLDEFHERHARDRTGDAIAAKLRDRCRQQVQEALVSVFGAPPVDGLGNAGGFKFMVEDRGNLGLAASAEGGRRFRGPRQRHAWPARHVHQPAGRYALDLSRHRPHQGEVDGRGRGQRLRRPASLHGLAVRQQLQRLRPFLAGQRAGRRPLPPTRSPKSCN